MHGVAGMRATVRNRLLQSEINMSKVPNTIQDNQPPPPPLEEEEEGAEAIISPTLERTNIQQPDSNSDPTIKNH
jgi:hypothetical protein